MQELLYRKFSTYNYKWLKQFTLINLYKKKPQYFKHNTKELEQDELYINLIQFLF